MNLCTLTHITRWCLTYSCYFYNRV